MRLSICSIFLVFSILGCNGGGGGDDGGATALPTPEVAVVVEKVLADLNFPVGLAFAPDERLFFTEWLTGQVRIVENGELLERPFITVPIPPGGQSGLLGIALDPSFSQNHYVYLYYTHRISLKNTLVRVTERDGVGSEETVLLSDLPGGGHDGGRLVFGSDRSLYVSVGDGGDPSLAQTMSSFGGKILRINREGGVPEDNPFEESIIFALGFRNVFGMAIHPESDVLYVSDNGPTCDDEVNRVLGGKNYGWRPGYVCSEQNGAFQAPLFRLPISSGVTGVHFYRGGVFPEFRNHLFLSDFNTGSIRRFVVDEANGGAILEEDTIVSGIAGGIIDVVSGSDGNLYFSSPDSIYKISRAS